MRIGEAIRLDRSDLSPGEGLLTIADSKSGASRRLLHPSTVSALGCYLRRRAELSPVPDAPALFVHPAGNRLNYPAVQQMFRVLLGRAGIRSRSERCRPTIHGLRHSFAVNTLIRWYREGATCRLGCRSCPPGSVTRTRSGPTGITPILGLFRRPPLRTLDGPGTWADALWLLSPVGIMRCFTCVDGTSSPAFGAHGDGAATFVRTGGSIG